MCPKNPRKQPNIGRLSIKIQRCDLAVVPICRSCHFFGRVDSESSRAEDGDSTQWPIALQEIVPALLPLPGVMEFFTIISYVI
jgi:hypothetical protein